MKTMKKIASMALALVMLMALAVPAMAAPPGEEEPTGYTLTITPPTGTTGTTNYKVYRVFDATTTTVDGKEIISYTLVAGKDVPDIDRFEKLPGGYVRLKAEAEDTELSPAEISVIRSYVDESDLKYEVTTSDEEDETIFVKPGYYFVTTTSGTAVSVGSTNKDAVVKDKTVVPSIKKEITGTSDGPLNIGSEINYKVTITVGKGAEKYVLHDKMGTGLTFNEDVNVVTTGVTGHLYIKGTDTIPAAYNYADYEDDDRFIVVFEDTLPDVEEIEVTYSATINALSGLTNSATVTYGDSQNTGTTPNPETDPDPDDPNPDNPNEANIKVVTVTINKIDTDTKNTLPGAKFTISKGDKYYNGSTWGEEEVKLETEDEGTITFISLADGVSDYSYTLIETEAPAGYNRLDEDITIEVAKNGTVKVDGEVVTPEDVGENEVKVSFDVENGQGSLLPSTGGIGTTIFTVAGGALMLGAAVLFITKKRSANG